MSSSIAPCHPAFWLSTWFGVGKIGMAPGTFGSLAALPFAWVIQTQWGGGALVAASLVISLIGWWAASVYMHLAGTEHDPKEIVIDEVAGQWLLLSVFEPDWQGYLAGFILFRLFDILKPWPISWADKSIKGGLGVMVDDLLAALFPMIILMVVMGI